MKRFCNIAVAPALHKLRENIFGDTIPAFTSRGCFSVGMIVMIVFALTLDDANWGQTLKCVVYYTCLYLIGGYVLWFFDNDIFSQLKNGDEQ